MNDDLHMYDDPDSQSPGGAAGCDHATSSIPYTRRLWRTAPIIALVSCLAVGCAGYSIPKPLSPSEVVVVQSVDNRLVAEIRVRPEIARGDAKYYESFRASIQATGLFSRVDWDWAIKTQSDVRLKPLHRCSLAEFSGGGFVPLYPILTFGLVPQIVRGSYHWAFEVEQAGQVTVVDCPISGAFGMGWIPKILKATGSWAAQPPEHHPRLHSRLSYEIAKVLSSMEVQ